MIENELRLFIAMAFILILIIIALIMAKKNGSLSGVKNGFGLKNGFANSRIQIKEKKFIDQKNKIVIFEVDKMKEYVFLLSENNAIMLEKKDCKE